MMDWFPCRCQSCVGYSMTAIVPGRGAVETTSLVTPKMIESLGAETEVGAAVRMIGKRVHHG